MSPEQARKLRERQDDFDDFYQSLMPGLVEFVELMGVTPAHFVLKQAAQYVPHIEKATKDLAVKSEEERIFFVMRMGWFIGEIFVQKFRGCWFVDDLPESDYFASYVIGQFKPPINPMLRIDPFSMAKEYVDSRRPRKLAALLRQVEDGVRRA